MSDTSPSHQRVDDFLSSLSEISRKKLTEDEQRRRELERNLDELRRSSNSSSPRKRERELDSADGHKVPIDVDYRVSDLKFSRERVDRRSPLDGSNLDGDQAPPLPRRKYEGEPDGPPLPRRRYEEAEDGPPLPRRRGDWGRDRREVSGSTDFGNTLQSASLKLGKEDTISLIRPVVRKEPTKKPMETEGSNNTHGLTNDLFSRTTRNETRGGKEYQSFFDIEDKIKGKGKENSFLSLKQSFESLEESKKSTSPVERKSKAPPKPVSKPIFNAFDKPTSLNESFGSGSVRDVKYVKPGTSHMVNVASKPKDKPSLPPKPSTKNEITKKTEAPTEAVRTEHRGDQTSKPEFKSYAEKDVESLNSAISKLSSRKEPPPKPKKLTIETFEKDKTELLSSQLKRLGQSKIKYRELESKNEVPEALVAMNRLNQVKYPERKSISAAKNDKPQINKNLPKPPPKVPSKTTEQKPSIHNQLNSIFQATPPIRSQTDSNIVIHPKPVVRSSTNPEVSGSKLTHPNKSRVKGPRRRLPKSLSSSGTATPTSSKGQLPEEKSPSTLSSSELPKQRKQRPPINKNSKPKVIPDLKPTRNFSGDLFI